MAFSWFSSGFQEGKKDLTVWLTKQLRHFLRNKYYDLRLRLAVWQSCCHPGFLGKVGSTCLSTKLNDVTCQNTVILLCTAMRTTMSHV
jgi:hypothetical protein